MSMRGVPPQDYGQHSPNIWEAIEPTSAIKKKTWKMNFAWDPDIEPPTSCVAVSHGVVALTGFRASYIQKTQRSRRQAGSRGSWPSQRSRCDWPYINSLPYPESRRDAVAGQFIKTSLFVAIHQCYGQGRFCLRSKESLEWNYHREPRKGRSFRFG